MRYNNEVIGLFPLRLFLLHQEQTTLHVNEPKFLQLVNDCLYQEAYFGIPFQSKTKLHEYGCVVKIVEVTKQYSNGNLDIVVECVQNFKLNSFVAQKENSLYPDGQLTLIDNSLITPNDELIELANNYNQLLFETELSHSPYVDIQHIVSLLSLADEEKLKLFKYKPLKKIQFLIHKLKFMSILVRQERLVEHQYHLN
ncbi:MAG: LON peptidase substrate-binding domain-containing protein [Flavobacteriales bacterium]|jgi:hypothetical protein|nr:LON peptidase substrate-binding domain-containing protein [Flavobacteriales bacterium]